MPNPSSVSVLLRRLAFGACALGVAAWGASRLSPLGGARNVVVPGFGFDGLRTWELRASQAAPRDAGVVDARDLLLSTFTGPKVETVVQSPSARFHTEEGRALSEAPLHVQGPGYEIHGEGWEWDANQSRIRIKAKVQAVFEDELTSFLD